MQILILLPISLLSAVSVGSACTGVDGSFRSGGADCGGFCAAAALHGRKVFEGRAKLRRPP